MSCGRAGDAILDELGLDLRSSERGRPKKLMDATVVSASPEPITAGPSNVNPGTSSDIAQLYSQLLMRWPSKWPGLWTNSAVMSMTPE